jgi:hypothetical protein
VTLSAAPATSAVAGTQVTFTAAASGCANPVYEFWMRPSTSSTWKMLQAYSATSTLSWNGSGTSGSFYFSVWARDAGSTSATFEANATIPYTVKRASCSAVTMSASPASPIAHGTGAQVTFGAAATGCSNPNPLYQFWMLNGSTWKVVQAWSTAATWTWSTTSVPAGTYRFSVWAKDAASSGLISNSLGRYDASAALPYTLSASCTSVTMTASPASPVAHGASVQVTWTGVAGGCSDANPLYEFWMLKGSTWTVVQGWSTKATWTWNASGVPAGTYHFSVWVRDAASPGVYTQSLGRYDAFVGVPFTLS